MQSMTTNYFNAIDASVRRIKAKAELYNGDALVTTYTQNDAIKSIDIQRVGEDSKFFGVGITHRINIKLRDVPREINVTTANHFKISLGAVLSTGAIEYAAFPKAFVTEVNRDENTNELSITAYDALKDTKELIVNDLELLAPYTIRDAVNAVGAKIGVSVSIPANLTEFDLEYPEGANFEGTETLQYVLTAASEVTQTVYYINGNDSLTFKRLDHGGNAVKTIDKSRYITLDSGANRRLQTICHATELGDNVSASMAEVGTTQYVRDNPFWDLRDDIDTLVNNALAAVGGMTINQFECEWRGDFSLEPGDKIALVTKDNKKANSYLLNDTITYDGGLVEKTEWSYTESETASSNPTSLGEALKQTFARVDKANKQIELLTTETTTNTNAISSLQLNTESILASVQNIEKSTQEGLNSVHNDVNELTKKVEASISAEDVQIQVKSELANGVTKVETTTGFTFDETGLTIAKSESEMKTNIDEDGMSVFRGDDEVLTADNTGVVAYNLKAKTYLIVGETSRFEDFTKNGEERTGCFWIGETEVE